MQNIVLTIGIMLVICSSSIVQAESIGRTAQPLLGGVKYIDCTAELPKLSAAITILIETIANDTKFSKFSDCLSNAPLIENKGLTGRDISHLLKNYHVTTIKCADLPTYPDTRTIAAGQASVGIEGEEIEVSRGWVINKKNSPYDIAALIIHELMHNYGFEHKLHDYESKKWYPLTVPMQAEACIKTFQSNPCPFPSGCSCQALSNAYGISAGVTFGSAPVEVQDIWKALACTGTIPSVCQDFSNKYAIYHGVTFGTAPSSIQRRWKELGCNTRPKITCQNMSNTYMIYAGKTFGTAPDHIQRIWRAKHCTSAPTNVDCQNLSDQYSITAGVSFGTAPGWAQEIWKAFQCTTVPKLCQNLSDTYRIYDGVTFGIAPLDKQQLWQQKKCRTKPSNLTCKDLSNKYKIFAGVTFGSAPSYIQAIWKAMNCNTNPN